MKGLAHLVTGMRTTGLCVCLALLLPGTALRADILTFDPLNGEFSIGDTFTVSVVIDDEIVDLRGFTHVFEFDPAIVTVDSVTAGALLMEAGCDYFFSWENEGAVGDSIEVDAAGLGCSINGPGEIIRFQFTATAIGTSPLACRSGIMRDSLNQDIPYTCVDGTITIVIGTPIERSTWGRLKSRYR